MGIFDRPPLRRNRNKEGISEGLWTKCPQCEAMIHQLELKQHFQMCHHCGHHFLLRAHERIQMIADPESFEEVFADYISGNPLGFDGYEDKIESQQKKSGINEAVVTGRATIGGKQAMLGVMDFSFFAGAMGSVVGEKLTSAIELGTKEKRGVIIFSSSAGARMQEGMLSLMQMAKTCGALARHSAAGLPYISVMTHPTTGGVTASFATIGDVNLAEPRCMIGFAGPRVVKETTHENLPAGFQTAEFMLEHGLVDAIVSRDQLRDKLITLLDYLLV